MKSCFSLADHFEKASSGGFFPFVELPGCETRGFVALDRGPFAVAAFAGVFVTALVCVSEGTVNFPRAVPAGSRVGVCVLRLVLPG